MCCDYCDHETSLRQIKAMREEERFEFADDTLAGIEEWVSAEGHITERQEEAVQHIYDSVEDRDR